MVKTNTSISKQTRSYNHHSTVTKQLSSFKYLVQSRQYNHGSTVTKQLNSFKYPVQSHQSQQYRNETTPIIQIPGSTIPVQLQPYKSTGIIRTVHTSPVQSRQFTHYSTIALTTIIPVLNTYSHTTRYPKNIIHVLSILLTADQKPVLKHINHYNIKRKKNYSHPNATITKSKVVHTINTNID